MNANTLRKARAALDAGDHARAIELASPVLARYPGNADARAIVATGWRAAGLALLAAGRAGEASDALARALEVRPEDPALANALGVARQALGDLDGAIEAYRRAASRSDDPDMAENLASALFRRGRHDDARTAYARLATLPRAQDRGRHRVREVLQVPAIAASEEAIAAVRGRLAADLDRLLADPPSIDAPERRHVTPMFLAYHGESNRDLHGRLGRLYRAATPSLGTTAPHCRGYRGPRGRVRVGFASGFLHDHSIGHTTRGFLERLDRERFEAIAIRIPPITRDAVASAIDAASDRVVVLPDRLAAMREAVAALELDVLFYQDIGMEPMSYFLAFARLAPVQCTSFGHPDTTGIDTIDAFVSGERIEPPDDPQRDYGERLSMLPGASVLSYYHPPAMPEGPADRTRFGFAPDERVYACPQALFKLHPRMDRLFARILADDDRARIALIAAGEPAWREALEARFEGSLGALASRVRFVPRMPHDDYLRFLAAADVALDTWSFNGMNTTLESFAAGLPVVTLPTRLQRGRHTAGMYAQLGMSAFVARDEHDYAARAVAVARDPSARTAWSAAIAASRDRLYRDDRVVRAFEAWFAHAAGEAARAAR